MKLQKLAQFLDTIERTHPDYDTVNGLKDLLKKQDIDQIEDTPEDLTQRFSKNQDPAKPHLPEGQLMTRFTFQVEQQPNYKVAQLLQSFKKPTLFQKYQSSYKSPTLFDHYIKRL